MTDEPAVISPYEMARRVLKKIRSGEIRRRERIKGDYVVETEGDMLLECGRCHARVRRLVCNGVRSICEDCDNEVFHRETWGVRP